jgi:hypothetical protein
MYILEKAFTFFLRGAVRYGYRGLFVLLEFLGCVLCDTPTTQRGHKKEKGVLLLVLHTIRYVHTTYK